MVVSSLRIWDSRESAAFSHRSRSSQAVGTCLHPALSMRQNFHAQGGALAKLRVAKADNAAQQAAAAARVFFLKKLYPSKLPLDFPISTGRFELLPQRAPRGLRQRHIPLNFEHGLETVSDLGRWRTHTRAERYRTRKRTRVGLASEALSVVQIGPVNGLEIHEKTTHTSRHSAAGHRVRWRGVSRDAREATRRDQRPTTRAICNSVGF